MATELTEDVASGGQPRAAVLLVVGEPFSDGDKTLILEEIVKGVYRFCFLCCLHMHLDVCTEGPS